VNSKTFIIAPDLHFPKVSWSTWKALLSYVKHNPVSGFIFLGDQFDNHDISHHTDGKPGQRVKGRFALDEAEFEAQILTPIEQLLPKDCVKVWIEGNHDQWANDLGDKYPELIGKFNRPENLHLSKRGWKVLPMGKTFKYGKLFYAHGESITTQYHAKKAVETFCRNLVYGHFHSPQSWTKVLPHDETQKWMAYCLPILGKTNPDYLENRPTSWINGFGIVEYHGNENSFNLYPIICTNGRFSFGGKVYPR